jgi:cytochrome b6
MKNLNYAAVLGRIATVLSIAIVSLVLIAAVTGILISFYYEPTAGGAYNSLRVIQAQIPFGWLIQRLHAIAGNLLIVVALIQIVVMFLGEKFRTSWLTAWISGILLTLSAIALSWTAMLLDWSQLGYWRLNIELGIIESIPYFGSQIREILTGGGAIDTLTVIHMYTLHSYLLSVGALVLSIIHLIGLVWKEKQEKQLMANSDVSNTVPN